LSGSEAAERARPTGKGDASFIAMWHLLHKGFHLAFCMPPKRRKAILHHALSNVIARPFCAASIG